MQFTFSISILLDYRVGILLQTMNIVSSENRFFILSFWITYYSCIICNKTLFVNLKIIYKNS